VSKPRHIPTLGLSMAQAAEAIGVSRSLFHQADKTGEIGPQSVKILGRRVWSAVELATWMANGAPARGRWVEIWPEIRSQAQDACGIGVFWPGSGDIKGQAGSCGDRDE